MYPRKPSAAHSKRKHLNFRVLLILGILLAVYPLFLTSDLVSTYQAVYEPLVRETPLKRAEEIQLKEQKPIAFLLLGVDQREKDTGRSDTMIVLTLNPASQSAMMLSIPRDTLTEIVGFGKQDKLNHAYAFGGVSAAVSSTEHLLDIPIDFFIEVNMDGFAQIVDLVGPVEVDNPFAFAEFQEGRQFLDGKQALEFVRMRHEDPNGDFGRQERQKQVIQNMMSQAASWSSMPRYPEILDSLGDNVRTNLTIDALMNLQRHYRSAANSFESLSFTGGHGELIDGIWYYRIDEKELSDVSTKLKEHLEMEEE